jgi:hypothetical protein
MPTNPNCEKWRCSSPHGLSFPAGGVRGHLLIGFMLSLSRGLSKSRMGGLPAQKSPSGSALVSIGSTPMGSTSAFSRPQSANQPEYLPQINHINSGLQQRQSITIGGRSIKLIIASSYDTPRIFGSKMSRNPSPMRFHPMEKKTMAKIAGT